MRLEQKKEIAERLAARLGDAGTIYLADFTGLDVAAMGELRTQLRAEGAEMVVAKNTLARRAFDGLGLPDLTAHLRGPTALVIGADDPVPAARVVREFAREHDDRPVVKVGIVDRRTIPAETVSRLAELPSRERLLGAIAGSLTAPVAGIAGALDALIRDIAYMIDEAAKKRTASQGEPSHTHREP